jgi:thiol-disulfide isomerase/thioredoxin
MLRTLSSIAVLACAVSAFLPGQAARQDVVKVDLAYRAPGSGPAPNFSPKGTQIALADAPAALTLPQGAVRPAKTGTMAVGAVPAAWIPVLVTADAAHPADLCQLFLDRNRNRRFDDDGPGVSAAPSQNEKTKAWWSSFNKIEVQVPYASGTNEPYLVNFWAVREAEAPAPDVIRFSVSSWRAGTTTVNGVPALVAVMDSNNDAIFDSKDYWSVMEASAPDAAKAVLSITEAKPTSRLMFVKGADREFVLQFQSLRADGGSIAFAVVDRPVTKAADRAGDDVLAVERARPRAASPFTWSHDLEAAQRDAKAQGKRVIIDFETTWCGPCKTMDEWIWTDAEVAGLLRDGYVGVKLDGDVEKAHVKRFTVAAYPTIVILDSAGAEIRRVVGYQSSKETLALIK